MDMNWTAFDSPLGPLTLIGSDAGLDELRFPGRGRLPEASWRPNAFAGTTAQLAEYFAGERAAFDLELDLRGSASSLRV